MLKENTDLRDELEYKIREHYGILADGVEKKGKNKVKINEETGEVEE